MESPELVELKRRLNRLTKKSLHLEKQHKDNELTVNYHAGFRLGYLKGQIAEIEDIIDHVEFLDDVIDVLNSLKKQEKNNV